MGLRDWKQSHLLYRVEGVPRREVGLLTLQDWRGSKTELLALQNWRVSKTGSGGYWLYRTGEFSKTRSRVTYTTCNKEIPRQEAGPLTLQDWRGRQQGPLTLQDWRGRQQKPLTPQD